MELQGSHRCSPRSLDPSPVGRPLQSLLGAEEPKPNAPGRKTSSSMKGFYISIKSLHVGILTHLVWQEFLSFCT